MEKFKEILKGKITERVTDGEVVFNSMMKNNGLELEAVTIKRTNENITPVLYLESFFKEFESGKSIDDIAVEIIDILESHRQKSNFNIQKLFSDENVKENVYFRIINKKRNKEFLKDVPHMTHESLAMIIALRVSDIEDDDGEGSIIIHNIHMERINFSEEELFTLARQNTPRLFPVWRKSLQEICTELPDYEETKNIVVLTNQSKTYGAATIFYKGVLRETAEILKADKLVILPSSVHEVIVFKLSTDSETELQNYKEMVQSVNYQEVRTEEILDDTYYLYDKKTDRIKVC